MQRVISICGGTGQILSPAVQTPEGEDYFAEDQALFPVPIIGSLSNLHKVLSSMNGTGWAMNERSVCDWSGISCNSQGHVAGANLSGWGLQGTPGDCHPANRL